MPELPKDVARELEELYGGQAVPDNAVTVQQLSDELGGSTTMWNKRLKKLIADEKWTRSRKVGGQGYWYWPIDEGN